MNKNSNLHTYMMLMLAAAIWGFQPSCIKWLREVWTAETIVVMRYAIVTVVLLGVVYLRERETFWPQGRNIWLALIGMGIMGMLLNNVLQFNGIPYTTVTNTTLISATTPAITVVLAFLLLRERVKLLAGVGACLSFAGVLAIVSHGDMEVIRTIDFNFGDMLCFLSQVSWALYSIIIVYVIRRMSVLCATGWASFFGCILTLIYGIVTGTFHLIPLESGQILLLLYPAFLGGIFALIVWNHAVKVVGASNSTIFLNVMPVAGMISGYLLFDEIIGTVEILGAAAIFTGVYLTGKSK